MQHLTEQVHVSEHPLVLHKLSLLRNKDTEPKKFRQLMREVSVLLFYEATRDLMLAPLNIQTPLSDCLGHEISEQIGLMPVLRAGLGMAEALLDIVPTAQVWHVGIYRDHQTLEPIIYYNKITTQSDIDLAIVLDPMLATGGSVVEAINILRECWDASRIKFIGLMAAPEGILKLSHSHPDVSIYLGAIDSHLDEHGYIVPGLGDAGDRQFGTM